MDQEDREGVELSQLLRDAANEKPGAAAAFFQALIRGHVYVPVKPGSDAEGWTGNEIPTVGEGRLNDFGFLTVDYQGSDCLPVFTEESFVEAWAEREQPAVRKKMSSLIWILGEETWLYLNPNQEIGKELTPWEIELMRRGEDAVEELAAAVTDEPLTELEVRSGNDVFPKLRRSLIGTLEIHPEIEEAFLVAVKEGGSEAERPMVGIRYSKVTPQKRDYVKQEIEETAKGHKSEGAEYIFVIDDLGEKTSGNRAIFSDAMPFYIKPKAPGTLEKARAKLKSAFGKKEEPAEEKRVLTEEPEDEQM